MKNSINKIIMLAVAIFFLGTLESCKKDEDVVRIQNIVPQSIIDDLSNKGMIINQGNKPPHLELIVRASPYTLVAPYGVNDGWEKGQVISDYFYKFYGQTDKQDITYDFKNSTENDQGIGTGAFVVGSGNKFTIFSEDQGVADNVAYKTVTIISGELNGTNIKNFQYAFVIKEKTGDESNKVLIPVGTGRLWEDGDFVSESKSNFRIAATEKAGKGTILSAQ